jgi:two-component system sensor histidine kinase BaeS
LKKRLSLRVTLFIAILCVALVCVLASAVLSGYLSNRQIGQFVQEHRTDLLPEYYPRTAVPNQNPNVPPNLNQALPPGARPAVNPPLPPRPTNINVGFIIAGVLGLVLALLLSFFIAGRISRPLSRLTDATARVAGGDYEGRVPLGGGKEVEELGEAFNSLAGSLERTERLRRNMVADISHELRNPLATLRGQIELMQDGKIPCDRESVDSLMDDVLMLTRIVEDLRQLSQADSGQMEFELRPVDPAQIVRDVTARFEREAASRGVGLLTSAEDLPPVNADPGRLAQVLGNLVANSMKHTPAGGTISIAARQSIGAVRFSVEDTGGGVSGEELPFIFDRFYRTDKSRARATGGAGLGLSIAKSFVIWMGGTVWAESEEGKGTTIQFTIPTCQQ